MAMTLNVGDTAPSFALDGDTGPIDPAALSGKAVVLYFYPKDDTSGCTSEAKAFTELHEEFLNAGAEVIGVSRDDTKSHGKFRAKYGLTFPLGSDVEGGVTEAYGVWVKKSMYGREYMGIERATFLIDKAGKIAKIWRKVKVPGHAAEVLAAVKGLS
jgi:peroxiredoxin Q/BCP